jgi:acetyl-CoA carboxylase biotin carboxylase subunit
LYRRILIANRGEIAVRVIRACRELGIATVAVYSEADEEALHVRMADEAVPIGPPPATQSYLNVAKIIEVAAKAGVDAIHPGYGFLSENPYFAAMCKTWGIDFIGPEADTIERMGLKTAARTRMQEAGVPIIPGTPGTVAGEQEAVRAAAEIGYPILVKAAAGGGGRGIRTARNEEELVQAIGGAGREAGSSFGNADLYLEKLLVDPRHVEMQILADRHGHVVHLWERDSSIQRRRQKILEEAPSPALDPATRERMAAAAVAAARAVDYVGAGTIEFLLDADGRFYFIEMNTRIQVEHPTTEMITGIDIVREQILVCGGEPISFSQEDVRPRGWAIECRINAEDPDNRFLPSPGGPGCGSTRASAPASGCSPSTTRSSPSSSAGAPTGRRPWPACGAPSTSSRWRASRRPCPCTGASWPTPTSRAGPTTRAGWRGPFSLAPRPPRSLCRPSMRST